MWLENKNHDEHRNIFIVITVISLSQFQIMIFLAYYSYLQFTTKLWAYIQRISQVRNNI